MKNKLRSVILEIDPEYLNRETTGAIALLICQAEFEEHETLLRWGKSGIFEGRYLDARERSPSWKTLPYCRIQEAILARGEGTLRGLDWR